MSSQANQAQNEMLSSWFSLRGKVAAVTGGARGIGLEIVRGLAEAGADVAMIYSSSTDAPARATDIAKATGVRIEAFQSDVASRQAISETIQNIATTFGGGKLDIVVANSGVCANIPALEYTEETWAKNNSVNLDGVMWTAQAAGKIFEKQGKGSFIITASVSAILVNIPQQQAAYNASKAAVVHLAKSLAVEWASFARVNCISPGFIETEMLSSQPKYMYEKWLNMIPMRKICPASDLKSTYVFLAGDSCPYMTGANLVIDGGYTLP